MPCAPLKPTIAISIRVLELYRLAHLRCPRLALQPWVKTLCDFHGVSPSLLFHQGTNISLLEPRTLSDAIFHDNFLYVLICTSISAPWCTNASKLHWGRMRLTGGFGMHAQPVPTSSRGSRTLRSTCFILWMAMTLSSALFIGEKGFLALRERHLYLVPQVSNLTHDKEEGIIF
jgi:hypothetical protein